MVPTGDMVSAVLPESKVENETVTSVTFPAAYSVSDWHYNDRSGGENQASKYHSPCSPSSH